MPRTRGLRALAATSALTIATQYFGIYRVAPEAVWLLARRQRRPVAWASTGALGAVSLLLPPLAVLRRGTGTSWIHATPLGLRVRQIRAQIAAGFSDSAVVVERDAGADLPPISRRYSRAGPRHSSSTDAPAGTCDATALSRPA